MAILSTLFNVIGFVWGFYDNFTVKIKIDVLLKQYPLIHQTFKSPKF
jgi:hypothetical protein